MPFTAGGKTEFSRCCIENAKPRRSSTTSKVEEMWLSGEYKSSLSFASKSVESQIYQEIVYFGWGIFMLPVDRRIVQYQ